MHPTPVELETGPDEKRAWGRVHKALSLSQRADFRRLSLVYKKVVCIKICGQFSSLNMRPKRSNSAARARLPQTQKY